MYFHQFLKKLVFIALLVVTYSFSTNNYSSIKQKTFQSLSGKTYKGILLSKYKAVVFVFIAPECPLCINYSKPLHELTEAYKNDNILVLGVFAGKLYTKKDYQLFAKKYKINFPLLIDEKYELTHLLNASVTPEVFVLNNKYELLYTGLIDDWANALGKHKTTIQHHYLNDCLKAITNNSTTLPSNTTPVGCLIE